MRLEKEKMKIVNGIVYKMKKRINTFRDLFIQCESQSIKWWKFSFSSWFSFYFSACERKKKLWGGYEEYRMKWNKRKEKEVNDVWKSRGKKRFSSSIIQACIRLGNKKMLCNRMRLHLLTNSMSVDFFYLPLWDTF